MTMKRAIVAALLLQAHAASAARYTLDELLARVRQYNPGVEAARVTRRRGFEARAIRRSRGIGGWQRQDGCHRSEQEKSQYKPSEQPTSSD